MNTTNKYLIGRCVEMLERIESQRLSRDVESLKETFISAVDADEPLTDIFFKLHVILDR
jgi:hypothetical protein